MKTIFFSLEPPSGSYGGGAFFVKNMVKYLQEKGYNITFQLQPNIDLLFIIDPRKDRYNHYSIDQIIQYKQYFPNVKIIHRVNECDIKREVSINLEPLLLKTMQIADHVVFISKWLKDYFINKYNLNLNHSCILNGSNQNYFFPSINKKLQGKTKIVTHHWSNNYLKGFHIYNELDKLLEERDDIEFTFIGNYNRNYIPKNIKLLPPTSGNELGNLIKENDIYLTATQNEPCGMHHIEGLSCGLPILYCEGGGAIKELCDKVGEEFNSIETLLNKLDKIKNNYEEYVNNINYKYLSCDRCSDQFMEIINSLI
jgi:hypothetical protein